jgi:hypothetical protein
VEQWLLSAAGLHKVEQWLLSAAWLHKVPNDMSQIN